MSIEYVETGHSLDEELAATLQAETVEAEPKLAELIELARELMLKKQHPGPHHVSIESEVQNSQRLQVDVKAERFTGLEVDSEITSAIEQFGADMLNDAFECLGKAGGLFLDLFMNAKSTAVKIDACLALEELVNKIAHRAAYQFEEEDKETFRYSPIRLTPKLIGVHPNNTLATTCLGKSILTASFFAKADVPMLHGGVILSAQQDELLLQAETIRDIQEQANHPEHTIPSRQEENLARVRHENMDAVLRHNGFHAATYAKIAEGAWMQFDPNYGSAKIIDEEAAQLDRAYSDLSILRGAASPNAEARLMLGISRGEYFFVDLARDMGAVLPSWREIDDLLLHTPSCEVYSAIIEKIFLPLFPSWLNDIDGDGSKEHIKKGVNIALSPARNEKVEYVQLLLARVLEGYVFTDATEGSFLESIKRCKIDSAYRQRRVEDLCIAPLMMVLTLESTWFEIKKKELGPGGFGHPCIDLGLPEYRIAMAVLSDIAVHYGDELPLSSWLAYWPSDVSLAEHIKQTPTIAQKRLAQVSIAHASRKGGPLTYPVLSDILKSS